MCIPSASRIPKPACVCVCGGGGGGSRHMRFQSGTEISPPPLPPTQRPSIREVDGMHRGIYIHYFLVLLAVELSPLERLSIPKQTHTRARSRTHARTNARTHTHTHTRARARALRLRERERERERVCVGVWV